MMNGQAFKIGQRLIFNHAYYQTIDITNHDICLQHLSNSQTIRMNLKETESLLKANIILLMKEDDITDNVPSPLKITSTFQSSIAMRRYEYILAATLTYPFPTRIGLESIIHTTSLQLNDPQPPSCNTVYRWWKLWLSSGKQLKSLENKPDGKKGYRRYKDTIGAFFYEAVNEVYLTRERQSKQETYQTLIAKIKQHNHLYHKSLMPPSRATFYRMLKDLDDYTVCAERFGIKEAEKIYRISGKGISTTYPLERAEIDHTPLDVMVVDDITGLTIGRPTLTCILDSHTRIPLALTIGFEPPSELSVIRALKQAIWPKDDLLKNYDAIQGNWCAHGIPSLLVCDNGLEFHSEHLRRVCAELNIELMFCPKHKPNYKGRVERFLGTTNRQVSQRLQGSTFSNILARGDYNSVQEAVITLDKLQEILYLWAIDIYMQTTHSSLNMSPAQKWHQDIQRIELRIPNDRDQFNLICAKEYQRNLNHEGINFKRLKYNSEFLRTMRIIYGTNIKVLFKVDPENLEKIWVYDTNTDSYLEVPCTDIEYAKGLTLLQHNMILNERTIQRKELEEENSPSLETSTKILNSKIDQLKSDKRIKKRTKAARIGQPRILSSAQQTQAQSVKRFQIKNIPDFLISPHSHKEKK